jgi:hypothetical protein
MEEDRWNRKRSKMNVHADNAQANKGRSSIDFLEANGMRRAPHSPHSPDSPDFTPSDFDIFDGMKRRPSGCVFNSPNDLLSALEGILGGFEMSTLINVFREWMPSLRVCIDTKGKYVS